MQDDWLPDDIEHAAMVRFLKQEGWIIHDVGAYPLLTYSAHYKQKHLLPASSEELEQLKHNGDHLRTAVMAARLGIPVRRWQDKVINLTEPDILKGTEWLANWNGVWIHKSHGAGGICEVSGPLKDGQYTVQHCSGFAFCMLYAQHIFKQDAFRHGVLCVCESARDKNEGGQYCTPFIADLKNSCREFCNNKEVELYGAYGETWVPLYGQHAGQMLLTPGPFIYGKDCEQYLSGQQKPLKDDFKNFVSKERDLEIAGLLSATYYDSAEFNPDTAITIHDHTISLRARHWYKTVSE